MSFPRPTLATLIDRVRGDLRGRLEIVGPLLRRAMVDILGTVWGGSVHGLYGYLDWLSKQLFGDTAEAEFLLRLASLFGLTLTPATFATGNVTATGTNGTAILVDTILSLDANTKYRVTVGQVIAGGTATLPVVALTAGTIANVPAGTALTFESPIAGVNSAAVVAVGGIADGEDQETIEELRVRYLERRRKPPEGGADRDYISWAKQVAGVTRAWVYPNENGLGTTVVRFVLDNNLVSIFPDGPTVAAVQAVFAANRPTTAQPTAVAPTGLAINLTIHLVPDTADTRAAVTAELDDTIKRFAEPGDGVARGTIPVSKLRTAVDISAGVTDYVMTVPAADVVPALGQLCQIGAITWA